MCAAILPSLIYMIYMMYLCVSLTIESIHSVNAKPSCEKNCFLLMAETTLVMSLY